MPPYVPRKRARPSTPNDEPRESKRVAKSHSVSKKPDIFDTLDVSQKNKGKSKASVGQDLETAFGQLDSDSELSSADSEDFEDVPQLQSHGKSTQKLRRSIESESSDGEEKDDDDDDGDDDEEEDWEDAMHTELTEGGSSVAATTPTVPTGNLDIIFNDDDEQPADNSAVGLSKRGPSKMARFIRVQTHCVHVQFLMWHNAVRNAWLCDKQLHSILVSQLPDNIKNEVRAWRRASGLKENAPVGLTPAKSTVKPGRKGGKAGKSKKSNRSHRDWDNQATRVAPGAADVSRGDPLLRLLRILTAYWHKRFTVTAPGLRKRGYLSPQALEKQYNLWSKNPDNPDLCGEIVKSVKELRRLARTAQGSRDVGEQLFTALLRALGLEARMVSNLQPVGFGWTKYEEGQMKGNAPADDKPDEEPKATTEKDNPTANGKSQTPMKPTPSKKKVGRPKKKAAGDVKASGTIDSPVALSTSSSDELSSLASSDMDSDSVIEIESWTPSKPRPKRCDRDLPFPVYWTEVLSTVTNAYIPVSAIVLSTIGSTPELISAFEPRGAAAQNARQVIAYVIAHSSDGSAKDVTVRYLRKHIFPGKTKGMRLPPEKVAIYNKRGKIRKYEESDWFKTVMSGYTRPEKLRTTVDDIEDSSILLPRKVGDGDKKKPDGETLQGYKNSAEFVLERHLRREEALKTGAQIVKHFTTGKGDNAKREPVYRRKDVLVCKTAESWHKEGREILPAAQPLKQVPIRAVTLLRKREAEEVERDTGVKPTQGLFAKDQTQWIIPPPISDGVIPKNSFGNIDVYVPSMVPRGAVHIPLKGTARICKKLEIDFAEAVTGFEFGNQRAVPVITGVVVAESHEDAVIDAWEEFEAEKRRKEDEKRTAGSLSLWRKFLMGMRIMQRVADEYGSIEEAEKHNPFTSKKGKAGPSTVHPEPRLPSADEVEEVEGGGFLLDDEVEEPAMPPPPHSLPHGNSSFDDDDGGGGFIVEGAPTTSHRHHHNASHALSNHTSKAPISLQAMHAAKPDDESGSTSSLTLENESDSDSEADEDGESDTDTDTDSLPSNPVKPTKRRGTKTKATPATPKSTPKTRAKSNKTTPAKTPTKTPTSSTRATRASGRRKTATPAKSPFFD